MMEKETLKFSDKQKMTGSNTNFIRNKTTFYEQAMGKVKTPEACSFFYRYKKGRW